MAKGVIMKSIHSNQDKTSCYFNIGDVIRGVTKYGHSFEGKITCVDIRLQEGKLHPCIDIMHKEKIQIRPSEMGFEHLEISKDDSPIAIDFSTYDFIWVEQIESLEVLELNEDPPFMTIQIPDWCIIGKCIEWRRYNPDVKKYEWVKEKIISFGYDGFFHQAYNCPVYYSKFDEYGKFIRECKKR